MVNLTDGACFGPYRLVKRLGVGGMGAVWEAEDTKHGDRVVALKVLLAPRDADDEAAAGAARFRFERECDLAARLNSPHVVPIYDYGEIGGQLYIAMARLHGSDLGALLRDHGSLSPSRAVAIVGQVARALSMAHRDGLVHRDVKPANIVITDDGEGGDHAYLIDFGIAWAATASRITQTGFIVGTLAYMAPEQFDGRQVDQRADVYALACVLYEALTGLAPFVPPHQAIQAMQIAFYLNAHLHTPPPLPSRHRADMPPELDSVVARGMAKDPRDRYPTAGALATAAYTVLKADPRRQREAEHERQRDGGLQPQRAALERERKDDPKRQRAAEQKRQREDGLKRQRDAELKRQRERFRTGLGLTALFATLIVVITAIVISGKSQDSQLLQHLPSTLAASCDNRYAPNGGAKASALCGALHFFLWDTSSSATAQVNYGPQGACSVPPAANTRIVQTWKIGTRSGYVACGNDEAIGPVLEAVTNGVPVSISISSTSARYAEDLATILSSASQLT